MVDERCARFGIFKEIHHSVNDVLVILTTIIGGFFKSILPRHFLRFKQFQINIFGIST